MSEQQRLTEEELRAAAGDPRFIAMYNQYTEEIQKQAAGKQRDADIQSQFAAIDFTARLQRYRQCCEMRREMLREFAEEDDWVMHTGYMPTPTDGHYLLFKEQCLRTPGYKLPVQGGGY
jgi:hypothetical protein